MSYLIGSYEGAQQNVRKLKTARFLSLILLVSPLTVYARSSGQRVTVKTVLVDAAMLFRGPMPAVEVMVNGQGPFLFAIDTGAQGAARVDSSLMEKLKLTPIDKAQASDGSGRNARMLDVVELDSISFGNVQFKKVRALTRDYNTSAGMRRIDGILGFNLFADYLLTLDFPAQRVRLERGELPKANGANIISFESPNGIPVITLRVGDFKINAHLDSGNTVGGFILPSSLVEKLTFANAPFSLGKARTVTSEVEIKEVRLKENINLGGSEFKEPTIVFPAISDEANIGSTVLREFALTFDQKNKLVRLERRQLPKASEKMEPVAGIPATPVLTDYTGRFKERTVTLEDGYLFLQRQGGPKLRLSPIAKDEFTLERIPEARLKFVRNEQGGVAELHVLNREGVWEKSPKQ